jgi:AcrR family transcriptional regulator
MPPIDRLSSAERREKILEASLRLFALHGRHGVTTRQIAEAAGMSEALLYRHFRSKDALFAEIQSSCLDSRDVADRMAQLPPSTSTLVLAIYFMVSKIVRDSRQEGRLKDIRRLMLSSLLEDGSFARGFLAQNLLRYVPKLKQSLEAAARAGDLEGTSSNGELRILLTHHIAAMVGLLSLPETPALEYDAKGDDLVAEIVQFSLRGIGLRASAIERYLNPKALALLIEGLTEGKQPLSSATIARKKKP